MKCLVTTLDGIVNDSSLPIFSALNCTAKTLQIWSVEPCPIYANGALRGEFSRKDFIETDEDLHKIVHPYHAHTLKTEFVIEEG